MSNLEEERWLNLMYLNICITIANDKRTSDSIAAKNKMEVFRER
jgi:hypothetical protein